MAEDERYNGWTNRETWAVTLYLNNDQGWQEAAMETARTAVAGLLLDEPEAERTHVNRVAGDAIADMVDELAATVLEGTATRETGAAILDMGSLWRVNWAEVGASFLDEW